jgi:DNA-binding HxlR family transcriptional regulator
VGLVDVVGKKWGICIVTLMGHNGQLRFGSIQRSLPRVSPATLAATLRSLETEQILRRVPFRGDGRASTAYVLTDSGQALYRTLLPLAAWLRRRHDREIHPNGRR